jgi:membrane protein
MADAALQPIPGRVLDPPPREAPDAVRRLDETDSTTGLVAGVGYRTWNRFSVARATLLAAGTTYYVFLALFSLVALGYGLAALIGADQIADYLTRALGEAFPGLIGEDGIDPALLRSIGQTAGIIGLVVMLYSGGGAMTATGGSIHLIYGAPPDPRNVVVKRAILLAWLLVVGPLIMASLVAGIATQNFSSRVMELFGWEGSRDRVIVHVLAVVVTLALDFLVVFLVLGRLGGIRPPTRSLVIGSLVGAVVLQVLRVVMGIVLKVSADKPQYGTLTLPIGILLVLYLNTLALFGAAALTAGIAERTVPIDEIVLGAETSDQPSDQLDEPDDADPGEIDW